MTKVAALIMVKNESKRILVTLNSLVGKVHGLVIFDTGSDDDTVAKIKKFSTENGLKLHLNLGKFEDFSTSRNMMLDFADTFKCYDYYILLDCNDELVGHPDFDTLTADAYMVPITLKIGGEQEFLDFKNIRVVKSQSKIRYVGPVHEYLHIPPKFVIGETDKIKIYQDRIADSDGKTKTRWLSDLAILKKELEKKPTDPRTQYYYAQTLDCLNMTDEAYDAYNVRSQNEAGFFEERFASMLKCAYLSRDEDEKIAWYLKAFCLDNRVEPLIALAQLYRNKSVFTLAYTFASLACKLAVPHRALFVDKKAYDYTRWHELSISAYYVNEKSVGKTACERALKSHFACVVDRKNMEFYQ